MPIPQEKVRPLREETAPDFYQRSRSYCYLNFQQDWGLGISNLDSVAEREFEASRRAADSLTRRTAVGAERVCCDGKIFFLLTMLVMTDEGSGTCSCSLKFARFSHYFVMSS